MNSGYFRHILVPVDGSDCSLFAVRFALRLAAPNGRVTFANAIHIGAALDTTVTPFGGNPIAVLDVLESERRTVYATAEALARIEGVRSETLDLTGSPAGAIVGIVPRIGADAVVMGTHGRRGFPRLILGSVAEAVLKRAPVPTFVVHAPHDAATTPFAPIARIVAAVDGSPGAMSAIDLALNLAVTYRARIFFVHVDAGGEFAEDTVRLLLEHARTGAAKRAVEYDIVLGRGKPEEALMNAAETLGADLIAVSARDDGTLARLIHAGLDSGVVQASRIPVVVTHERQQDFRRAV